MAIGVKSGVPSAAANGKHGHTLISDGKFRQLYALTLKMRLLAEGEYPWLSGKEAMLAGVAADLRVDDVVLLEPGVSGADVLRPDLPENLLKTPLHAEDALIEAVGRAAAARIRKSGAISVVFCTESMSRPVLHEARLLAIRGKLPLLFVERGNAEDGRSSSRRAIAPEQQMPSIAVDKHDVVAVYRVAHESIARAREGSGPTRMQCVEWQPAATARRRLPAGTDAVEQLETWLESRGLPAQQWRRQIMAEKGKDALAARQAGNGADGAVA